MTGCVSESLLQNSALTNFQNQLHLPKTERLAKIVPFKSAHSLRTQSHQSRKTQSIFILLKQNLIHIYSVTVTVVSFCAFTCCLHGHWGLFQTLVCCLPPMNTPNSRKANMLFTKSNKIVFTHAKSQPGCCPKNWQNFG